MYRNFNTTQRKCEYSEWNSGAGRGLGKTEEMRELNDHLSSIELRIYSIYKDLTTSGLDVNGEVIKAKFLGFKLQKKRSVVQSDIQKIKIDKSVITNDVF